MAKDKQIQVKEECGVATLDALNNIPQVLSDEDLDSLIASSYVAYMKFMSSRSGMVEEGKFPVNHFALFQSKQPIDLGESVDVILCSVRSHALAIDDGAVISSYKRDSALYKEIEQRADTEQNSGCLYGAEFLCYIPERNVFATFLMGTKTMRRDTALLVAIYKGNKFCTLKSKVITVRKDGKTYTYASVNPVQCSVELAFACSNEYLLDVVNKFNNPPESVVEPIQEETTREI